MSGELALAEFDFAPGLRIEERIDGAEVDGIRARWEFGRWMLTHVPEGKTKLPDGFLTKLAEATGKSQTELRYRRLFAEGYPTEEAFVNALTNHSSWYEIVNKAFARKPRDETDTPPLPEGVFSTIVADPPWEVKTPPTEFGGSGSAQALEYPTLSVAEIAALEIEGVAADDAHLYLWTINAYVEDAFHVARSWGFEPSTLLVWCKAPHGIGQGGTYVLTTEYILFARRGSLAADQRIDRSWFDWPRRAHSVKPEGFYSMVEATSPGPHLELFAREEREGWVVWGDEVEARDEQLAA